MYQVGASAHRKPGSTKSHRPAACPQPWGTQVPGSVKNAHGGTGTTVWKLVCMDLAIKLTPLLKPASKDHHG